MRHNHRVVGLWVACCGMVTMLAQLACGGDTAAFAPVKDSSRLVASVKLSVHAYNLSTVAPYDTVRLHATALLGDGTSAPAILRFRSTDVTKVVVDSLTGVVTAIAGTTVVSNDGIGSGGVITGCIAAVFQGAPLVIASATYGGVTRSDTAVVGVIPTTPRFLKTLRLRTSSGNGVATIENVFGAVSGDRLFVEAKNIADSAVSLRGQLCAGISFSNPQVVSAADLVYTAGSELALDDIGDCSFFSAGSECVGLVPGDTGVSRVGVELYAYGSVFKDSITVRVRPPHIHRVNGRFVPPIALPGIPQTIEFFPSVLNVLSGDDIIFSAPVTGDYTEPGHAIDIIFDDPSAAEAVTDIPVKTQGECFLPPLPPTQQKLICGSNEHGGSGNIPSFRYDHTHIADDPLTPENTRLITSGSEARRFTKPGRYPYHTTGGGSGVIVVQ